MCLCRRGQQGLLLLYSFQSRGYLLTRDQSCGYELASKHECQQTLTILPSADLSESQIEANILMYFKDRGIYALEHQPSNIADTLHWIVEFDDLDPAWVTQTVDKGWVPVGSHIQNDAGRRIADSFLQVADVFYMMMSPFGLDGRTPPRANFCAQLHSPAMSGTRSFEVPNGLDSMSLVSSPLAMQSMARAVFSPALSFGNTMHMTSWPMYPWAHAVNSPQSSYSGFMSPGSIPSAAPTAFQMSPNSAHQSPSAASPKTNMFGRPVPPFQRSEGRRNAAMRINRAQFSPPSPHHNHVDINRIKAGTDVRTTVCHNCPPLPPALANNFRSCSEISPTRWTKRC